MNETAVISCTFWLAYFALRGFIEYLWLRGSLKGFSETDYVVAAWLAAFFEGLPEMFYAYYLTYRVWPRLEKKRRTSLVDTG
ncbi:hypothetical protein LWM68_20610 [Niabella sp. W65]|nr:hypothetical protein [Niabella sp. W65]MCH7364951.1 hypothetical protein [Niabella sp. W65]ULT40781.1 hypothetical protein KRR40_39515 [Niabella sp. I65]